MQRIRLIAAVMTLAACSPVENAHPPSIADLGFARVLTSAPVAGQTGESKADRIVLGLIAAGPTGALIGASAESNLGTANLFHYQLEFSGQAPTDVRSFSIVAPGDCVIVSRIGDKPERVLERTDPTQCPPEPPPAKP